MSKQKQKDSKRKISTKISSIKPISPIKSSIKVKSISTKRSSIKPISSIKSSIKIKSISTKRSSIKQISKPKRNQLVQEVVRKTIETMLPTNILKNMTKIKKLSLIEHHENSTIRDTIKNIIYSDSFEIILRYVLGPTVNVISYLTPLWVMINVQKSVMQRAINMADSFLKSYPKLQIENNMKFFFSVFCISTALTYVFSYSLDKIEQKKAKRIFT